MKIKISSIEDIGGDFTECVVLEVLQNTDIGKYILLDFASSKITHTFWFPDMQVKQGDLIRLYTTGAPPCKKISSGHSGSVHELYWNLSEWKCQAITDCLALIEASDWCFQEVKSKAA